MKDFEDGFHSRADMYALIYGKWGSEEAPLAPFGFFL